MTRLAGLKRHGALTGTMALVLLMSWGCAKTVPQEVTDVNRELGKAKDNCADVLAPQSLGTVQRKADAMNGLADRKKYKKARKQAEPLLSEVQAVTSEAGAARAAARKAADAAITAASRAIDAARDAEAGTYAAAELARAEEALATANQRIADDCSAGEAEAQARVASEAAERARNTAVAEKKRLEEEQLTAERKRKEEEARRLEAERRRLEMFPPNYTVQQGDSLWRVSGMEKIYEKSAFWPIIFDANGDGITDPDLIYPGQELSIPREISDDAMRRKLADLWWNMAQNETAEEE